MKAISLFLLLFLTEIPYGTIVEARFTHLNPEPFNLGVRVLRPVYAIVPVTRDGVRNVTVVMTIWLKRVGAANGVYDMPHQSQAEHFRTRSLMQTRRGYGYVWDNVHSRGFPRNWVLPKMWGCLCCGMHAEADLKGTPPDAWKDAIRMTVWVDNPVNLFQRTNGHLLLPTEHDKWSPTFHLETTHPGPLLPVVMETGDYHYRRVWGVGQRPYSFRVNLTAGTGDCFKIVEASYPMHKNTFCLPPAAFDSVCSTLAPAHIYTNEEPALYTVVGPIRHPESSRDWSGYYSKVSGMVVNYVTYHVAMGSSGLLLYADEMMRKHFGANQELLGLMEKGYLRLIDWDLPERAHNDTDGVGRPLGYNYDQGLVSNHILLALSSCGANLLVLIGDLDEFIYFPKPGRRWPKPWMRCMGGGEGSPLEPITVHRIHRFNAATTKFNPSYEPTLWTIPGTLNARINSNGTIETVPKGAVPHPLVQYDVLGTQPLPINQVKQASLPAAWIVLFWVHEGVPLYGKANMVNFKCVSILHIPNEFRGRYSAVDDKSLGSGMRYFRHWMFLTPNSTNASLWEP
ncbi:hypothetical protein VOLCADRAFT_98582 [Volvox carteri f. nagariensis]|uniref:Glycosyltransferase family 92 protein n=1 Tax=Volvox carteri f. nagariensis TaxID=3068 RepID=D8UFQ9_VOLCA|nr:uncharacterized protein VOLCADRAFT_98582 [Volvox carteri f. nagariensis]EFJ41381.1 hypothetical protein VOLCADRAFT_98582 [Volvox carteri f. nagariensis]|eukprot:XP_002957487.1 hypothetical protein VOLCADRAFT_98582 [Volvox carteri f. nagariensis]